MLLNSPVVVKYYSLLSFPISISKIEPQWLIVFAYNAE